jgi:nicotinamide-nucleotide amidase
MVCFGFAIRSADGITSRALTEIFPGDRTEVRHAAVVYALRGLLELVGQPVDRSRPAPTPDR